MTADLHIHIRTEEITDEVMQTFFCNVLGSKYCNPQIAFQYGDLSYRLKLFQKMNETPNCWIGEVSWLKAEVFDDGNTYIPNAVGEVSEIFENETVIDDDVIKRVEDAMSMKNDTSYGVASKDEVVDFLKEHKGERAFTITW